MVKRNGTTVVCMWQLLALFASAPVSVLHPCYQEVAGVRQLRPESLRQTQSQVSVSIGLEYETHKNTVSTKWYLQPESTRDGRPLGYTDDCNSKCLPYEQCKPQASPIPVATSSCSLVEDYRQPLGKNGIKELPPDLLCCGSSQHYRQSHSSAWLVCDKLTSSWNAMHTKCE